MTTYVCTLWVSQNISILMYIMCVILCLFSALSRRAGALQISIIVIGQTDGDDFNMAWAISIARGRGGRGGGPGVQYKQQGCCFFLLNCVCYMHTITRVMLVTKWGLLMKCDVEENKRQKTKQTKKQQGWIQI